MRFRSYLASIGAVVLLGCGDGSNGELASISPAIAVSPFSLSARHAWTHANEGAGSDVVVADFTGDGCADLVYAGPTKISTYVSQCNGDFAATAVSYQIAATQSTRVPRAADVDGDGAMDLIYMGRSVVEAFISLQDGRWADKGSWALPATEGTRYPLTGDLNRDGKADLIFFEHQARLLFW